MAVDGPMATLAAVSYISALLPFNWLDQKPEIMALWRSDARFLGNRLRYVNVGVSHHSNGRGGVESWMRRLCD